MKKEEIDFGNLKKACQNTFKHRNTDFNIDSILDVLQNLKDEQDLKTRWKNYQKRFTYAEEVSFNDVISTAMELIEKIK
jgi:hypothetical protein